MIDKNRSAARRALHAPRVRTAICGLSVLMLVTAACGNGGKQSQKAGSNETPSTLDDSSATPSTVSGDTSSTTAQPGTGVTSTTSATSHGSSPAAKPVATKRGTATTAPKV